MTRPVLLLTALALSACSPRHEEQIQTALDTAVLACQTLLNDPRIPAEPQAREWCRRLIDGCRETGRP